MTCLFLVLCGCGGELIRISSQFGIELVDCSIHHTDIVIQEALRFRDDKRGTGGGDFSKTNFAEIT